MGGQGGRKEARKGIRKDSIRVFREERDDVAEAGK